MKTKKRMLFLWMICVTFLLAACGKEEKEVLEPPKVESGTDIVQSPEQETAPEAVTTKEEAAENISNIEVYLNGNAIETESGVYEINGQIMLPVSEICGYYSRSISCVAEGNVLTVTDEKMNNVIVITSGSKTAQVNGKDVEMEAEAVLAENGTFLIEMNAFQTLLDTAAKYQQDSNAVYLTESGLC